MSEEPANKSQDIVMGITVPRRLSIATASAILMSLASAIAFATTLNGRVKELEDQALRDRDSLQRIERTLCMMCVQELGASSCNGICRTGGKDE